MPRNLLPNHFDTAGIYVEGERSSFRFNKPVQDTFISGMLVPLGDPIPVFPGVKLDLVVDAVIRSNTMIVPPLDGIYIDWFSVWIPHRIVWTHMPQFLGENDSTAWTQSSTYVYPSVTYGQINNGSDHWYQGDLLANPMARFNFSLFEHYGLMYGSTVTTEPVATKNINILAARGYYSLWNYLFRDENYQRPVLFSKGDIGTSGEFGYLLRNYKITASKYISDSSDGLDLPVGVAATVSQAVLMPVNKLHDAITSGLPQAQYGNAPSLFSATASAPVMATGTFHDMGADLLLGMGQGVATTLATDSYLMASVPVGGSTTFKVNPDTSSAGTYTLGDPVRRSNLVADLSAATSVTINQFRTSVMYQRYLEALARGGRRMPEYLSVVYGVKNSNAKCDYPELLNRSRYMLGVNQVVATADGSGSGWTSHLGDTGAYSLTSLRNIPVCEKDFTEFGYLHICYCVRADNRYSQLIQPHFNKINLLDEYNPFFDHIGDVGLENLNVNTSAVTKGVFSYQEAWWDERTQLAMANGALNKKYGTLKYWILGEIFDSSLTSCTASFLTFNPDVFEDVFVSSYYVYPQFIMDARIHGKKIARMSQHSIPGIVGRI